MENKLLLYLFNQKCWLLQNVHSWLFSSPENHTSHQYLVPPVTHIQLGWTETCQVEAGADTVDTYCCCLLFIKFWWDLNKAMIYFSQRFKGVTSNDTVIKTLLQRNDIPDGRHLLPQRAHVSFCPSVQTDSVNDRQHKLINLTSQYWGYFTFSWQRGPAPAK